MLCAPAAKEKLAPTACGTHHIFLTQPVWLVIIRLPIKSITAGLTWVAAYIALELANGRSNGLDSWP